MDVHVSANKQYDFILSTTFVLMLNVHSHTKELSGLIGETEKSHKFKTNKDHKLLKIFLFNYHFNYRSKKNNFLFFWFTLLRPFVIWSFTLFTQEYIAMTLNLIWDSEFLSYINTVLIET